MNRSSSALAAVALVGAVFTAPLAQAQSYGAAFAAPTPFYPYAVQADQPYAVEVAPNTYVIKRPALARNYPYVRGANALRHKASVTPFARVRTRNDRAVIEELRQRHAAKRGVIETKKIVHDKPVVIETRRVVDDPPRIIERRGGSRDSRKVGGSREPSDADGGRGARHGQEHQARQARRRKAARHQG
jgi:hypothetical protein